MVAGIIIALFVLSLLGLGMSMLVWWIFHKSIEKHFIQRAVSRWHDQEIIPGDLKEKILSLYAPPKKRHHWTLMQTIYLIGSLFIGIGFILFIASNWEQLAGWSKLALVLALAGIALFLGEHYRNKTKRKLPMLGEGLILLSSLLWGAGIIFLFQSTQWAVSFNALITGIWILSILPLYLWLKSEPIFYLIVFLSFLWGIFMKDLVSWPFLFYFIPLLMGYFMARKNLVKEVLVWTSAFIIIPFLFQTVAATIFYLILLAFLLSLLGHFKKSPLYLSLATLAFVILSFMGWNMSWGPMFWLYWALLLVLLGIGVFRCPYPLPFGLLLAGVYARVLIHVLQFPAEPWTNEVIMVMWLLTGALGLVASLFLQKWLSLYRTASWISYLVMLIALFFLSSHRFIEPSQLVAIKGLSSIQIVIIGVLMLLALALGIIWLAKKKSLPLPLLLYGYCVWLAVPLIVLPAAWEARIYLHNFLLLASIITTFFWANQEDEPVLFYAGMVSLLVFILLRYTDLFWNLMDRSIFFVVGGIVLLVIGVILEKQKKHILERSLQDENS